MGVLDLVDITQADINGATGSWAGRWALILFDVLELIVMLDKECSVKIDRKELD